MDSFEWRILGAGVLVGLLWLAAAITALFSWGIALWIEGAVDPRLVTGDVYPTPLGKYALLLDGPVGIVNGLLLAAAAIGLLWLLARLALMSISAAADGRIDLRAGWMLTRDAAIPIVAFLVVWGVLSFLIRVGGLLLISIGFSPAAGATASSLLIAAIGTPISAGFAAYVFRAKRGAELAIVEVFA